MPRLLLLAPRPSFLFRNNSGACVLDGLSDAVFLLTDTSSARYAAELFSGPIQTLPYPAFASAQKIFAAVEAEHHTQPFTSVGLIDESLMEIAAELRLFLGVEGIDPDLALRFRDKTVMKAILAEAGVRVPSYLHNVERSGVGDLLARHGRVVLKERKGFGSRGVTFIDDLNAFDVWAARTRDPEIFEAEEFISAPLYNVNTIVIGGKIRFTAVIYNEPGMADVDFSSGAPFVSYVLPEGEQQDRFVAYAEQVRAGLGLENGVMHLECFYKSKDEIVFCEVAARPGGGGVMRLIESQFGINMARVSLQLELKRYGDVLSAIRRSAGIACFIGFRSSATGFIRNIASHDDLIRPWVERVSYRKTMTDFVALAAHCTDFIAHIDYRSETTDDFLARATELNAAFNQSLLIEPV
ncbi:hypothetical protein AAC691_16995 [Nguyenibacter vanlangensis]|uniref:ATP-grasp domain-containing protein n=1 Tax=Nguyenibacter vanlangensis TaxID=1216886 RepID=A0ABZ3D330_9PROT